jgi:hypothetical protein
LVQVETLWLQEIVASEGARRALDGDEPFLYIEENMHLHLMNLPVSRESHISVVEGVANARSLRRHAT